MEEIIRTNKNGLNIKITAKVLSDPEMREFGFTDYKKDTWYYAKNIPGVSDISFNVSIPKDDPSGLRIDVLDEYFLQPYDYQYLLEKDPKLLAARTVRNFVEREMIKLKSAGIINGHEIREYI